MPVHQEVLEVRTRKSGLIPITDEVGKVVHDSGVTTGLCHLFIQHTSASLVVQENADPSVLEDLQHWLSDLAPERRAWTHQDEGPDDMPAHAKSAVTHVSLSLPIRGGRLALGTWQGVFLWEHRSAPHLRRLVITVLG